MENPTSIDVTPRVKVFVERALASDQLKDNSPMTLDSAEWYIEAGLNYTESQVWLEYSNHATDSLEAAIPIENALITASDAQAAYIALRSQLDALITPEVNHLVLADVALIPSGEAETVIAKVLVHLGSGYEKDVHTGYGANEHIWYGSGANPNNCGCGPNNGGATVCADLRIQSRIRGAIGLPADGWFWHSVVTRGVNWAGLTVIADINFPLTNYSTGIPATPYMLYRCVGQTCSNCIPPAHMSFYTQKAWDLMLQLKPTGKNPSTAEIDDMILFANPPVYSHMALYSYGNLQCPPK